MTLLGLFVFLDENFGGITHDRVTFDRIQLFE
jgi:hypothetical protein